MQAYYAQLNSSSICLRAILQSVVVYAIPHFIDPPAPPPPLPEGAGRRGENINDYDFTAHAAYSLDATEDAALSRKLDQDIHDALLLLSCICIGIVLLIALNFPFFNT